MTTVKCFGVGSNSAKVLKQTNESLF